MFIEKKDEMNNMRKFVEEHPLLTATLGLATLGIALYSTRKQKSEVSLNPNGSVDEYGRVYDENGEPTGEIDLEDYYGHSEQRQSYTKKARI